ncbi:MAG: alpha/beta fold hydrolase [Aureispira sp.]
MAGPLMPCCGQPQVQALKARYKVITFDWLGFGSSDKPTNYSYTFTQQKEVLNTVLQTLLAPDEKVTLVGHDIGGPPAILWAQEHAERVQQLVLLNTVLYTFSMPLDKISHTVFKIPLLKQLLGSRFGLGKIMQSVTRSSSKVITSHILTILKAHQELTPTLAIKLILAPVEQGKQDELLSLGAVYKALTVPKHLIIAQKDPLCSAHMQRLQEENPSVGVDFLPNCGHYLAVEEADKVSVVLLRVLG